MCGFRRTDKQNVAPFEVHSPLQSLDNEAPRIDLLVRQNAVDNSPKRIGSQNTDDDWGIWLGESARRPSHQLGEIVNKAGLDEIFRRIGGIERLGAGPKSQAQADSHRDNWSQQSHYGLVARLKIGITRDHLTPGSKGPSNAAVERTADFGG